MATSKERRAPPEQVFEKYNFTRVVGPGVKLFPIATAAMLNFDNEASHGVADDKLSPSSDIGFEFKFNENTYDRFVASTNGFLVLREKSDVGTFDIGDYLTIFSSVHKFNSTISDRFTTKGIMLCPWFDDLSNAATELDQTGLGLAQRLQVQRGISLPPVEFNPTTSGLKYARTIHPCGSRCLVVRWRSYASYQPGSVITFEVVLYESGKIEFGYDTRKTISSELSDAVAEGATVGIFINDRENSDGTYWRFRDLSIGLGHPSDALRNISRYGGAEYAIGYTDTNSILPFLAAPYNVTMYISDVDDASALIPASLGRKANWPGQDRFCSVMTFSPPVARRKVLPRREVHVYDTRQSYPIIARTGDASRSSLGISMFDDRRSINFNRSVVDFPTTLPRGYGNSSLGAVERLNLYGDFEFTASVSKANVDPFLANTDVEYISPYSDHRRPEQDPSATGEYYSVGSPIEDFGLDLKSPLKSKTHIKFELPIQHPLQMLETGSAIYYYNKSVKGLFVPQGGSAPSDIMDPREALVWRDLWPEDARGFGPLGNVVASGSNPEPLSAGWSSNPEFGRASTAWVENTASMEVLSALYEKSVQINPDYKASPDELFSVPINQPFLLEKAVFEIPMKFGPGWFNDRTTSSTPIGDITTGPNDQGVLDKVFDFGGPAITLSLFNQVDNGHTVHRDLILTGTIIPEGDNYGNVAVRQSWIEKSPSLFYPIWLFEPEGFTKYNSLPSAVVNPSADNTFTGSVSIPTVAGVSNGVVLRQVIRATNWTNPAGYADTRSKAVIDYMTKSEIGIFNPQVPGLALQIGADVKSVNPFGRDSRGKNVSGRSLFGKDYVTFQTADGMRVKNPLFVSSSFNDFPVSLKDYLDVSINPDFQAYLQYAIPIEKSVPSPYLLMPGDKLVFGLSKTRPVMHTNGLQPVTRAPVDIFRHGLRHDVWVNTGSISVTLYGSLLREGIEFHDTLNQSLVSEQIHETIGMEPVCDQFQVDYEDSFYGTYTDAFITGSIFPQSVRRTSYLADSFGSDSASQLLSFGSTRGRIASKVATRAYTPSSSDTNLILAGRKSAYLQPIFEKTGRQLTVRASSGTERFYDSLMPDFVTCARTLGQYVHFITDPERIFKPDAAPQFGSFDRNKTYGMILIDSLVDIPDDSFKRMNLAGWSKCFPYEPKFSSVERKKILNREIVTRFGTSNLEDSFFAAGPRVIDHLLICQKEGRATFDVMCDVDFSKRSGTPDPFLPREFDSISEWNYVTSSMSKDDMSKVLYGFGDEKVKQISSSTSYLLGGNNEASFRDSHSVTPYIWPLPHNFLQKRFKFGPVIRGWKYGVHSGIPSYSSLVFRRDRYGNFRDMLEQRLDTKFYNEDLTVDGRDTGTENAIGTSPVRVKFVNPETDQLVQPEVTMSSNLSFEATSSLPFFDALSRNR